MSDKSKDNNNPATLIGQGISDHLNALKDGGKKRTRKREEKEPKKDTAADATTAKKGNVFYLPDIIAPVDYDAIAAEEFIYSIFPEDMRDDENIACFFETGNHSKPIAEDKFLKQLRRTRKPARLYYGVSTVGWDTEEQRPLNRKNLFKRFWVLVLDDIGTKIDATRFPEAALEPTYRLETSEGNFQWGYVLEEPIDDYDQAFAFISLFHDAGFTDEGGKLVTKKVRLPQSVHGKKGSKDIGFRSRITEHTGKLWTPQELLTAFGITTTFEEIVEDAEKVKRTLRSLGTSSWSPVKSEYTSFEGIVDPLLEWMGEEDMILEINDDWVTIPCPFADTHSIGTELVAYYSPLGCGEGVYAARRQFHCFHSHPEGNLEFLEALIKRGAPEVPLYDPAAELVASHVFDTESNTVWDIKTSYYPYMYKNHEAFKSKYVRKHWVSQLGYKEDGETKIVKKAVAEAALWLNNPSRVTVSGVTFDPTTRAKMVDDDGHIRLNTFAAPNYGQGPYDQKHVDKFTAFLEYLLPNEEHRGWFIMWLAAKMQNFGFRGWGFMMIAKQEGSGRGTLEDILRNLFGYHNCANVPFEKLTGGIAVNQYNEWQAKLMVFTSETQGMSLKNMYEAMANLREVIDTTVSQVTINNKFGMKHTQNCHSSHLMFSNHELAAAMNDTDRRICVVENTHNPAPPSYFTNLRRWMHELGDDGLPAYRIHIARWLMTLETDMEFLNGRAPETRAKSEMIIASKSALDTVFDAVLSRMIKNNTVFITPSIFNTILTHPRLMDALQTDTPKDAKRLQAVVRGKLADKTKGLSDKARVRLNGGNPQRVRILLTAVDQIEHFSNIIDTDNKPTSQQKEAIRDQVERVDINELLTAAEEGLSMGGYL